jgi:hypothetical protein
MILLLDAARAQWSEFDRRIAAFDPKFVRWSKGERRGPSADDDPGYGAIIASALVAAVGRAESFNLDKTITHYLLALDFPARRAPLHIHCILRRQLGGPPSPDVYMMWQKDSFWQPATRRRRSARLYRQQMPFQCHHA